MTGSCESIEENWLAIFLTRKSNRHLTKDSSFIKTTIVCSIDKRCHENQKFLLSAEETE